MTNQFVKNWITGLFFYFFLFLIYFLWLRLNGQSGIMANINFLHWDAEHYEYIRNQGFDWMRCAFFPLFPFLWKLSGLNGIGISILNGIVFSFAIACLLEMIPAAKSHFYLFLSIPSFAFLFYPYTESLFFLSGVLLIAGWRYNLPILLWMGFFLTSLIRPAILVMAPALLITEFLIVGKIGRNLIPLILAPLLALLAGLFITISIHYSYTGSWSSFLHAQEFWGNHFGLPTFPLRSWGGDVISRLDGVALLISILCTIHLGKFVLQKYYWKNLKIGMSRELGFSLLYCAGSGMMVLFFRNGELYSLNRFLLVSPFFIFIAAEFIKQPFTGFRKLIGVFIGISCWWLLFASYVHLRAFLKYEGLTLFLMVPLLLNYPEKRIRILSFFFLLSGNILLLLYFHHRLLVNQWLG